MTGSVARRWAAWVADHEIWPLMVGVVLATFTERWAGWGLGLIGLVWLVRWVGRGRLSIRTPVDWPVALLLLLLPVTFYATTDRQTTFAQVSRLLAGVALMYSLVNWAQGGGRLSLVALGLTGAGLGLAVVAPVSVRWSSGKFGIVPSSLYSQVRSLGADAVNPNMMAGALVMLVPFPLASLFLSSDRHRSVTDSVPGFAAEVLDRRWFRTLWQGAAALLMLGALVLTQSRSGWVAGVLVVYVVLVRRWRRMLWLIPTGLLGLGLLARWQGVPALLEWIATSGAVSGWDRRVEIWSRALYMIQDFPFTGIGVGTFGRVANVLYPFFLAGPDADIPHAHNVLLQVGVDLGIPGMVGFVAILLLAFWSALDGAGFYSRTGNPALAAVAWAGLASLVGMLVHGMVHASTWIVGRGAFIPWAVMGTLFALINVAVREVPRGCSG